MISVHSEETGVITFRQAAGRWNMKLSGAFQARLLVREPRPGSGAVEAGDLQGDRQGGSRAARQGGVRQAAPLPQSTTQVDKIRAPKFMGLD
jgi:hypothetical protein